MNIIRLGTKFINLDRVIDAEICLDEQGDRGIALRYVVADTGGTISAVPGANASLLTSVVKGTDALALENYLNECGVVLTTAEPEPTVPCEELRDDVMPAILEL